MSSSTRHRLLTVQIRSAEIYKKSNGPYYVKLSYSPEEKLETKSVFHDILFRATWNQGFVFAVPHTALSDGKSSIKFEIFRKNGFLKDSLLGKLEVKLDELKAENKVGDEKEEVKYDTANEYSGSEDDEEREKEERDKFPEIKKRVSVKINKVKLEVEMVVSKGLLNKVGKGCYWRGFAMEYDEFLGNKQVTLKAKKKKSSFFLMCVKN